MQQENSPFFQKLPRDVRIQIYAKLLKGTNDTPLWGGFLLQRQESSIIVANADRRQAGIDVAILRTCWFAYIEAAWALYARNMFIFNRASEITDFRSMSLRKVIIGQNSDQSPKLETVFNFQPTPSGRLSKIAFLTLVFTHQRDELGPPPVGEHNSRNPVLMEVWSDLLFQDRQRNGNEQCSFPALKHLKMDFQDLGLGDKEGIAVCD